MTANWQRSRRAELYLWGIWHTSIENDLILQIEIQKDKINQKCKFSDKEILIFCRNITDNFSSALLHGQLNLGEKRKGGRIKENLLWLSESVWSSANIKEPLTL